MKVRSKAQEIGFMEMHSLHKNIMGSGSIPMGGKCSGMSKEGRARKTSKHHGPKYKPMPDPMGLGKQHQPISED